MIIRLTTKIVIEIFYLPCLGTGDYTPIRSYAPSSLPDPPTKPVVSDVTDTSVHLSWAPGVQVGPSPVFAFHVEYFGYETMDVSYGF